MKTGSAFFEWTHKRLNGEEFPAIVLLSRVELDEKHLLQTTVRDITKRKKMERELENLASTDPLTGARNRKKNNKSNKSNKNNNNHSKLSKKREK